mmetsp:Transcript_49626/g.91599  ORF Transcript_49626/g.91599 Transcript_49626/m.91599 type:complete len:787 (-) Transcript_49626:65-2425(-)
MSVAVYRSGWAQQPRVDKPVHGWVPRGESPMSSERNWDRSAKGGDAARGPSRLSVRPLPNNKFGTNLHIADDVPSDGSKASSRHEKAPGVSEAGAADSDSDSAAGIATSVAHLGGCLGSSQAVTSHEGWLRKAAVGGDGAVTWHRRYFSLHGSVLTYSAKPGNMSSRSVDIRRVQQVFVSDDQPRELCLDMGKGRQWRLRADDLVTARRWKLMLEAGRLVGSMQDMLLADAAEADVSSSADEGMEASESTSSTDAESSEPAAVEDSVQKVDTHADEHKVSEAADPAIFSDAIFGPMMEDEFADDRGPHISRESMLANFATVLSDINQAFGQDHSKAQSYLHEYLHQVHTRLHRWVKDSEPLADEVKDTIVWLLEDLRPTLEASLPGKEQESEQDKAKASHKLLASLEDFLLSEWETRFCDELFRRSEAAFAMPADAAAEHCAPVQQRIALAQDILRLAANSSTAWREHAAACDRSVSVLLSTLNNLLRSYRGMIRVFVAPPTPPPSNADGRRNSVRHADRMVQALRGLRQKTLWKEAAGSQRSITDVAYLALEVASLAESCQKEKAAEGSEGCRAGMLDVFAGAFEREAAELCAMLAEVHFRGACRQALQGIAIPTPSFARSLSGRRSSSRRRSSGGSGSTEKRLGSLDAACAAASGFVEDLLPNSSHVPKLLRELLGTAIAWVLVGRWASAFCRAAPKLSGKAALLNAVAADEASMSQLGRRLAVEERWRGLGSSNPLKPLMDVALLLGSPSEQVGSQCFANLRTALGPEKGQTVADSAIRAALQ